MHILFISGPEIIFILFVIVIFFGSNKLPDIARGLGKGIKYLRNATDDMKSEVLKEVDKDGIISDLQEDVDSIKRNIKEKSEEILGPIKRNL